MNTENIKINSKKWGDMKLVIYSIKKSCIIFFLLVMLFIIGMSFNIFKLDKEISVENQGAIFIHLQQESNPFDVTKEQYEATLNKLKEQTLFTYYEIYQQGLDLNDALSKKLMDENIQVNDNRVSCIQIGKNVIDDFAITLEKGQLFEEKDFIYLESSDIPVILGNAYSGVWDVGTRFEGEYLYDTYNFIVVGILGANQEINLTSRRFFLDYCVLMPSFQVSQKLSKGLQIHYANKTSGVIKSINKNITEIDQYIQENIQGKESGKYSWYSSSLKANFKNRFQIELYVLIIIIIVLILLFALYLWKLQHKEYKVKNKIKWSVEFLILVTAMIPYFLVATVITYSMGMKSNYWIPLLIVIVYAEAYNFIRKFRK